MFACLVTDLALSSAMLSQESFPHKWFHRRGFIARKLLLLQWLVWGNILAWGYRSTLLSILIPIRYEATIKTVNDLNSSGLPLLLPRATAMHFLMASDPRPVVKQIYNKSIVYPYNGTIPSWVVSM